MVAHVLRMEGVLHYTRGLAERIDKGEPVAAHTEREVEIHAFEIVLARAPDFDAVTPRRRNNVIFPFDLRTHWKLFQNAEPFARFL